MDKTYQPQAIEQRWTSTWEKQGYFKPSNEGEPYCIMLPPPNVTGTLHMGHGFQYAIMDALIRRQRMLGNNTLWQPGTDHAGIATQMVVERNLAKEGLNRHDVGRDAFIEKVWEWREHSGSTITGQIRRLGASLDWERERFSMDDDMRLATNTAFLRLYEEGLIYRGKRLVNWDPKLHTAISDLEVESKEQQGHLWHIRYPLSESDEYLVVATTRPETMLGDTAVAVHPEDERYQHLIGKTIRLPLTDRDIPIIADDYVDREFGTGCVKITPAHDFNDYEMGKRHDLPLINILDINATLNDNVPAAYQGMERFAARKQIVADLQAADLIEKIDDHQLNIPYGDRSGAIIEPMLTDQWFIKADVLAKPAIEAVKQGDVRFIPKNWTKTYLQWLENIQDWCISRQLWWGHRIPVWSDADNNHYVGLDEADVRSRHQLGNDIVLEQDTDVLDTWFTASLYPFATLGWPNNTPELETFLPSSVLVTGFDIIFFWVARMVMMSLKLTGKVPFKEVYITGLIRDTHGQKMSKTKGNVLDPIDLIDGIELDPLIEKRCAGLMQPQMAASIAKITKKDFPDGIDAYGTDALRFTFCALATTGRDINFDMGRIAGYRNFCNKIWNAARYVLMNTEEHDLSSDNCEYSLADRWIQSELQQTIQRVSQHFTDYRFDLITQTLYEFTWNEYCDWYLELSKATLNHPDATSAQLRGTRRTLLTVLETLLRLMHPLIPFITEEIWQPLAKLLGIEGDSIMLQPYPEFHAERMDEHALQEVSWLKQVVTGIRNIRSEMLVAPSKAIDIILSKGNEADQQYASTCQHYIKNLSRVNELRWQTEDETLPPSATAVIGDLELHIPLADLIDKDSELARLDKEMIKLRKEFDKSSKKLANDSYVKKAPAAVVNQERERLTETEATLEKLQAHYVRIESM